MSAELSARCDGLRPPDLLLNVFYAYMRQNLTIEVDTSFAGLRATRMLKKIMQSAVCLKRYAVTTARANQTSLPRLGWSAKIDLVRIPPGKPTQNNYVESFNSKLREEYPRISWFLDLFEA